MDANGTKVPTKYTVKENTVIKTVSHKGVAAYPVVADPSISAGRYWYVRYNRDEVNRINVALSTAGNATALALACAELAPIPAPLPGVLSAACGNLGGQYKSVLAEPSTYCFWTS